MTKETNLHVTMAKHGISVKSEFVPFSKSRNANNKDSRGNPIYSLNWKVTLQRNGRDILTTDYSSGIAHCPSYKQGMRMTIANDTIIRHEIETGTTAKTAGWGIIKGKTIEPDSASVVYSLASDSDVLDYGKFEEWASEYGYEPDSRSAEKIYQSCLEIALQLRAGLGESVLSELREASQDF